MKLKYDVMNSPKHQRQKKMRLATMKEIRVKNNFTNSRDYLVVANKISGNKRIASRARVNQIILSKVEVKNG